MQRLLSYFNRVPYSNTKRNPHHFLDTPVKAVIIDLVLFEKEVLKVKKFALLFLLSTIVFFFPMQNTDRYVLITDDEQSITDNSYITGVDVILSSVSSLPQLPDILLPKKPSLHFKQAILTSLSNVNLFAMVISPDSGGFLHMVMHCSNYLSI